MGQKPRGTEAGEGGSSTPVEDGGNMRESMCVSVCLTMQYAYGCWMLRWEHGMFELRTLSL